MFSFVNSCLTKHFIKLGGVLSCVMASIIMFFHNCKRILEDEADVTLVIWGNNIFIVPFTVENSSIMADCLHFILTEIITRNNLLLRN